MWRSVFGSLEAHAEVKLVYIVHGGAARLVLLLCLSLVVALAKEKKTYIVYSCKGNISKVIFVYLQDGKGVHVFSFSTDSAGKVSGSISVLHEHLHKVYY